MASNQTQHYQLSQWEASDKVERLDFNIDNAKVDAALHGLAQEVAAKPNQSALDQITQQHTADVAALRSENLWAKVAEVTLSTAASAVTLNIPNAGNYQRLELYYSFTGPSAVKLSTSAGVTFYAGSGQSKVNSLTLYNNNNASNYPLVIAKGRVQICQIGSPGFYGSYEQLSYEKDYYCHANSGSFLSDDSSMSGLAKLTLNGTGNFAAGARFVVYGIKK